MSRWKSPIHSLQLPEKGEIVSLDKIKEICQFYGLSDLWIKIKKDPPQKPFQCDGCSLWFDRLFNINLYPACFKHDLKYWAGYPGEWWPRFLADAELLIDVAHLLQGGFIATCMFIGVRCGGAIPFIKSLAWGFGRREK